MYDILNWFCTTCYLILSFQFLTEWKEPLILPFYFLYLIMVSLFCVFQTDIKSIRSQPNIRYVEASGRVFKHKADYVDSIVRACARKSDKYALYVCCMYCFK